MNDSLPLTANRPGSQFGLASLFEFTTVCSVLSLVAIHTGILTGITLMLLALALGSRRGEWALAALVLAMFAVELPMLVDPASTSGSRPILMWVVAAGLCGWYALRRAWKGSPSQ
jgi:hypothetical protein